MYEKGGNAVDAAIAAAFVQCVLDPLNASIGGFGVAQIRPAGEPASQVVAFHGRAPSGARPEMFALIEAGGKGPLASGTYLVEGHTNQLGYLAPTVPGTIKGLTEILEGYGRLGLPTVLAPAIETAENGWIVTWDHWFDWTREPPEGRLDALSRFMATPEAARIYTRNGKLRDLGSRIVNPDYARTLRLISTEGPESFYTGKIATIIHNDFGANGGLITSTDLAQYHTESSPPLETTYRGYRITSSPPPAGGIVVLEILSLLEGFDLAAYRHNSAGYVHIVSEAMRIAFDDMNRYLGDPRYVNVPMAMLLDKAYAAECRTAIHPYRTGTVTESSTLTGETTHVVAVDQDGTWVSITHSLGAASGVVTPGLGFMFNGQMHRFDPVPGRPNSIAPGKRRTTGMAPTIIWKGNQPRAVLGAVGGNSMIVGVVQVVLNLVNFGMDALSAVSASRFHCEGGKISLEGRFPAATAAALEQLGHSVEVQPFSYDRTLAGAVYAITNGDAKVGGAADPRQGGICLSSFHLTE